MTHDAIYPIILLMTEKYKTPEGNLPEKFKFTPEERSLSVRAVGNYLLSQLTTPEPYLPVQAYNSITSIREDYNLVRIDHTIGFLNFGRNLITKLANVKNAEEVGCEFTEGELELLSDSLFGLGTGTVKLANKAIENDKIRLTEEDKTIRLEEIEKTENNARTLYNKLVPTLIKYKLSYFTW